MNKTNLPLVSVIVPTRNSSETIGKVLKSIKNQKYKTTEILVVDNNSNDKTKKIAQNYTRAVFNVGPERSSQKNFGAKKARGKYLLFLDSDAILARLVIEDCVRVAEKDNLQMVIIPEKNVGYGFWASVKSLERSFYLGDDSIEAPWFFEKESFLSVGGYDESMYAGEDWDLFERMMKNGFKHGRCKSFINHQLGKLTIFKIVKKKYYYGTNIGAFFSKDIKGRIRKNPLLRKSLLKNVPYLFKSPFKYGGIFVIKFFESLGILAGMATSLSKKVLVKKPSKVKLSKLLLNMFYGRNVENSLMVLEKMDRKTWISFLKLLSANRILYYFVTEVFNKYNNSLRLSFKGDLKKISLVANDKVKKTKRTLDYLNKNLSEAILVKTYKFKPYITSDLDILISSKILKQIPQDLNKSNHPGKQNKYQKIYSKKKLLKIDLHKDFSWQGFKFVDSREFLENCQTVDYFGRKTKIPNFSLEFLLNCAHILFERRYISFLDFWYLNKLDKEKKVDWKIVESQAEKYGWLASIKLLLKEIENINKVILDREELAFPVFLSAGKIARIYKEKYDFDKKLPLFDIVYYLFARIRGWLGVKTKYPYYLHWFDFSKL